MPAATPGAAFDHDLLVIGGGSGGLRAARLSADLGARVALCEERDLGGTCVNRGCIPKKLLAYAARYASDFADARAYGWSVPAPVFNWPTLIANKNAEIARLNGVYARLLDTAGVSVIRGRAVVCGPHEVDVGGRCVSARHILVATGGRPHVLDVPGAHLAITSDDAFHLATLPARVLVVGGGYVGVEFAGIFHGCGARTTHVYRGPLFLRGFDDDARRHVADGMRRRGVDLRFACDLHALEPTGAGAIAAHLTDGTHLEVDRVLIAAGRAPATHDLGLARAGVALDARGAVIVDARYRSSVPSIYAVGDVIDRVALTPVALAEGTFVARHLFGGSRAGDVPPLDYDLVPTAVFGQPELAAVGLTEARARERHGDDVAVFETAFTPLRHTLTQRGEKAYLKLVVRRSDDRVLGCHMVGADAAEVMQGFAVALTCGATKARFDATLGIHPTVAEELVTLRAPAPR